MTDLSKPVYHWIVVNVTFKTESKDLSEVIDHLKNEGWTYVAAHHLSDGRNAALFFIKEDLPKMQLAA